MIKFDGKKTGIFAAGVAFGTAGIKILTSKDAKKLYTNCTAAVLRAKDVYKRQCTDCRMLHTCTSERGYWQSENSPDAEKTIWRKPAGRAGKRNRFSG